MKKKWLIINYHIYEFKIIVYDMKLKWINWNYAYDDVCDDKNKNSSYDKLKGWSSKN